MSPLPPLRREFLPLWMLRCGNFKVWVREGSVSETAWLCCIKHKPDGNHVYTTRCKTYHPRWGTRRTVLKSQKFGPADLALGLLSESSTGKVTRSFQSTERVGTFGYRAGRPSRPPLPQCRTSASQISSSRCLLRPQIRRFGHRAPRSVPHPTPGLIEGFQSSLV